MSDVPQDPRMFYYGSFSGLWVYFEVDAALLSQYVANWTNKSIAPAVLDGKGAVNLCFMSYASHSGMNDPAAYADIDQPLPNPVPTGWFPPGFGVEPTNECEFNAVVYPSVLQNNLANSEVKTLRQFALGADVTKVIGHYRLRVPCDDRIAVFFGSRLIHENKVQTRPFQYKVPSLNNPGREQWNLVVPGGVTEPVGNEMFTLNVDVSGLPSVPANTSELVNYSTYFSAMTPYNAPNVYQQRRNIFGAFNTYFLDAPGTQGRVNLCYGNSTDEMVKKMKTLLGDNPVPVIVQTFSSMPAATETPVLKISGDQPDE